MKPQAKKGIIITSVGIICIASVIGIKIYLDSSSTIEVNSVASLNTGYYDDPTTSSGFVSNSDAQSIYYDSSKTITQIYVQVGQSVNAGDPLLSYDLTSIQSTIESNQLDIEKIQNSISLAQYQLTKLTNTTPDPSPTPEASATPTADPVPFPLPSIPQKDENGYYPYILSLEQAENYYTGYKIYYTDNEENLENDPSSESTWSEEYIEPTDDKTCWYWVEYTYLDGSTTTYNNDDIKTYTSQNDIHVVGSKQDPYVFNLTEESSSNEEVGIIYGKLFKDNSENNQYFQFNLYSLNDDGEYEVESSWKVKCSKFAQQVENDGDTYSLITHSKEEQKYQEVEEQEDTTEDTQNYSGYSEAELAKAIRDKKQELVTLDLDLRKAQLTLKENQELLSDGIVKAKKSGVIRKVGDINDPPTDGSAFLEVAGGQGYYIQGTVSELLLDSIKVGDTISAYSWTNGITCSAKITSVDTIPSTNDSYSGSGNPNVSYYGFEAYVDDDSSLTIGEYLELTLSTDTNTNDSIWLSKAYVKQDGKKYYVMKEEDGKLVKQYVTVGNIVWGDTVEITDGLNDTDYIAFAYSKNAIEGTKTKKAGEVTYG